MIIKETEFDLEIQLLYKSQIKFRYRQFETRLTLTILKRFDLKFCLFFRLEAKIYYTRDK